MRCILPPRNKETTKILAKWSYTLINYKHFCVQNAFQITLLAIRVQFSFVSNVQLSLMVLLWYSLIIHDFATQKKKTKYNTNQAFYSNYIIICTKKKKNGFVADGLANEKNTQHENENEEKKNAQECWLATNSVLFLSLFRWFETSPSISARTSCFFKCVNLHSMWWCL